MRLKKPKFWDYQKISFWSVIFLPFSMIYLILISIRRNILLLKNHKKISIPIICVGNIYIGGTGKTPIAKEVFNIIKSLGKNPAFIKKEYRFLNDEIKILKKIGKTFTCKKRQEGISSLLNNNHDVAILDDGFQDFSVKSDLSILCFNSKQLIGNGLVLPSGPLREPLNSITRADCIIINGEKNLEFENKISKFSKEKKIHIFYSKYQIKDLEKFKDKEIMAFAGIGNPSNFFDLLKENNLNIKNTLSFPDHHNYSEKDFKKIKENESFKIVTTEKDYYRMSDHQKQNCDCIEVDLEIENKEKFKDLIKSYL